MTPINAIELQPGVDPLAGYPLDYEPDVDLFAGGGGASVGMEAALGKSPDIAINHDPEALAMHIANHPGSLHLCQDIVQVNPLDATGGRRVRALWASPDCKHFSKAKGGKPRNQFIRDLAWTVVRWAHQTRPKLIGVENVEEFQTWGPLDRAGQPIKARAGETFREWVRALRKLGYTVAWRELVASDFGAPTTRKRLFVIARLDRKPIRWPKPTHGAPKSPDVQAGRLLPWRTVAECINWHDPAPSIFERKRPLVENTLRRIAEGIRRYVLQSAEPFIVTYYGSKGINDFRGQPLSQPLKVQTTENRHSFVSPYLVCIDHAGGTFRPAVRGADAPLSTIVQENRHALATANLVLKNYTGVIGHKPNEPLGTVTSIDPHSLVSASLIKYYRDGGQHAACQHPMPCSTTHGRLALYTAVLQQYNGASEAQPVDDPLGAVTSRDRFGLAAATLYQYNGRSECQPLEEPLPAICRENKHGLVICDLDAGGHYEEVRDFLRRFGVIGPNDEAEITVNGIIFRIWDIGLRMLRPRELFRAHGFSESYNISPIYRGKPLTITSQTAKCGNSVPPAFVKAVYGANLDALDYTRPPLQMHNLPLFIQTGQPFAAAM